MTTIDTFKKLIKNNKNTVTETIDFFHDDIIILKKMATEQNVSIEFFISYILHKYVNNELLTIEKIKEDFRILKFKSKDKKSKRDYLEKKYNHDKDDIKITIQDPIIKEYIKEQTDLNNMTYNEYITKLVGFEKEENDFVLNKISDDIKDLENGTVDLNTLSSFDDLLEELEKSSPKNILGEYATKHNLSIYESLYKIVHEHKEYLKKELKISKKLLGN